ncbi:kinesin-domain-containing protein [Dendrothele bispora CBS 962.96]|uniref:Kinesin-domain-containing protein n=1 Tax=Dendrothele bispora (strain CBS 962.96) TaxID=1314807 RepID=A0A4S8LG65_DENBC|nr:kinesin-domain-containing protein [Dendrothele bispora CBS 962.96]
MDIEQAKVVSLQEKHQTLERQLSEAKEQDLTRRAELNIASDEIANMKKKHAKEVTDLEIELDRKERMWKDASEEVKELRRDLERERENVSVLKATVNVQSSSQLTITAENTALKAQYSALQGEHEASLKRNSELTTKMEEMQKNLEAARWEAMESEAIRRKLHNMVQELKGNIRVFCRVRPVLSSDLPESSTGSPSSSTSPEDFEKLQEELKANMSFPDRDHKEIVLRSSSESATGQERIENYNFSFDRVFRPESTQAQVFEEISMLAQSCIDGYNVCIFAYGQTGSGKSFTMEGGLSEATQGMIPRAVEQVFRGAEQLKTKGWEYKMEGQFVEIYNETINDLLGKGEFDKKKHEIKHDVKTGSTRVTDIMVVPLQSPTQVRTLLSSAQSRRSVAATLMNERSSRSHSVFTLRISGSNASTGETCEGCLNLVDLAGSERINVSFGSGFGTGGLGNGSADKERLKETQSINRSLSALGDVIAALGEKSERGDKHIPYRNSKLTYLLQNSLSGNSKTLMVLNLSPLAAHMSESLTSLRFATKVNNTTIGTAKKQIRGS